MARKQAPGRAIIANTTIAIALHTHLLHIIPLHLIVPILDRAPLPVLIRPALTASSLGFLLLHLILRIGLLTLESLQELSRILLGHLPLLLMRLGVLFLLITLLPILLLLILLITILLIFTLVLLFLTLIFILILILLVLILLIFIFIFILLILILIVLILILPLLFL